MDFKENFAWQERYTDAVRYIVGPLLLEPADIQRDMTEATDFLVLKARDMRIGCRIRRASENGEESFAERYPWEFTIRSRLSNGAKTELAKIREGWGDWLFYGHAEHNQTLGLCRWFVIDLDSFRAQVDKTPIRWKRDKSNRDGTFFDSFDILTFRPEPSILVASSHDIPVRQHV